MCISLTGNGIIQVPHGAHLCIAKHVPGPSREDASSLTWHNAGSQIELLPGAAPHRVESVCMYIRTPYLLMLFKIDDRWRRWNSFKLDSIDRARCGIAVWLASVWVPRKYCGSVPYFGE